MGLRVACATGFYDVYAGDEGIEVDDFLVAHGAAGNDAGECFSSGGGVDFHAGGRDIAVVEEVEIAVDDVGTPGCLPYCGVDGADVSEVA